MEVTEDNIIVGSEENSIGQEVTRVVNYPRQLKDIDATQSWIMHDYNKLNPQGPCAARLVMYVFIYINFILRFRNKWRVMNDKEKIYYLTST